MNALQSQIEIKTIEEVIEDRKIKTENNKDFIKTEAPNNRVLIVEQFD